MKNHTEVSIWVWLIMPVAVTLLPYVLRVIDLGTDQIVFGEKGIIENLTVIALMVGVVVGVLAWRIAEEFGWLRTWLVLMVLGAFYFAGEELSWGQHWLGWGTPEMWARVNDQQETNIHNTSALFDQVPRTLLTLAAVVGGILVPLGMRLKGSSFRAGSVNYWLWPTIITTPVSCAAVFVSLHEKVYGWFGQEVPQILDIRAGETKECLLAIFIMLYLLSVYKRLRYFR